MKKIVVVANLRRLRRMQSITLTKTATTTTNATTTAMTTPMRTVTVESESSDESPTNNIQPLTVRLIRL